MRVADLPGIPGLGLRLLARGEQDRQVRRVYTTDLPDPGRYLSGGELVLTGLIWCRAAGDTDRFTTALARAGAAALAAGEALGPVPEELVRCCARLGLPLLAVPAETSFGTVTDEIMRRLAGDRSGTMDRVLGRRRQLLSAITEGGGLDALFRLSGTDLRAGCWLLTATGRQLAGTEGSLPGPVAVRLARQYLAGGRLPAAVRAGGKDYTLLAAGGRAGLAGWFLACAGSARDWPDELRESAAELAADVALERARLDAGRRGERRLGQQIISTVAGGAGAAEVGALLRAAGLPAEGRYVAVAAAAQAGGEAVPDLAGLVEELVLPVAARAAVGGDAAETLALVPLPGGGPARADPAGAAVPGRPGGLGPELSDPDLAARIREAEPLLAAGLRGGRLTAGISDAVTGSRELAAALREARGARRLAGLRSGPVCVVTGDEAGTHAMLLASVPADVLGSFRDRLIGPLLRYDRRRGAELVPTLSAFLACSGSWTACADRLHVHVNTLRYRIRRIEELTGRDLSSLDHRVDFVLALDAGPAGIRPGPAGEG